MNPDDRADEPRQAEEEVPRVLGEWRRAPRLPWRRPDADLLDLGCLGCVVEVLTWTIAGVVALAAWGAESQPRSFLWTAVGVLGVGLVVGVALYLRRRQRRRRRW